MTVHIALLRAVNLPAHNKVAMTELRALAIALGFTEAQTLLQSGNLVFRSEVPRSRLHLLSNSRVKLLPGFQLEDGDKVCCVDQCLVLRSFTFAQRALIRVLGQRVDALLHKRGNLQFDDAARRLRIQAST